MARKKIIINTPNYFGINSEIPWDIKPGNPSGPTAKQAIIDYYKRHDRFTIPTFDTTNGTETMLREVLRGFSFDRDDLKKIIDSTTDTDRIMFAFGFHNGDFSAQAKKGFTLIMMGIHDDGTYYNLKLNSPMFDFCEPCPTKCTKPKLEEIK